MLRRLMRWLTPFKACFGHRAEAVSLAGYVSGLLSDSPRKSMQAMLARVTDAPAYHALQHFITNAPWSAAAMWRQLRAQLPERRGVLLLDDTGFPKKGTKSVGVARQYTGTLGKVGNCQVAVTAALWTGVRAWLVAAALYLPESWTNDRERCQAAHVPETVRFRKKWQIALHLLQQVRASGMTITAVLSDSGYGDATTFRTALHRLKLPYGVGVSDTLTVFLERPALEMPRRVPGPRQRWPRAKLGATSPPVTVKTVATSLPADAWQPVTWQHGDQPVRGALCAALRVTPAHDWHHGLILPEIWLLLERPDDRRGVTKCYFINLPRRTALGRLVRFVHQRWPIEQQYQQLKTELGLDHFEGRTYPGWNHHVVVSAVAYAFLQAERRHRDTALTFEAVHTIVQEIFVGLLFASRPRYARWLNEARQFLPLRL
ncbi:MAG: IS701 family transposase [Acidobacteria bacterium]|nr:IS701 family transposase [Acidobacteriota bacterium]